MDIIHHLNIIGHIVAGTVALVVGLLAALSPKGGKRHIRYGTYFTWAIGAVCITGFFGIVVFGRNNFLLVITLLSSYNCFSGIRAIQLCGGRPKSSDLIVPLLVILSAIYYLYYIISSGLYWAPVIVYSTVGALFAVTVYDLCKVIFPGSFLRTAMLYEHAYKMISSLSAISSAFVGTVLPEYKPYSQFLPSLIGILCIIVTFKRISDKANDFPALHN